MLDYLKSIFNSLHPTVNNEYTDVLVRKIDEMKFEPINIHIANLVKKS